MAMVHKLLIFLWLAVAVHGIAEYSADSATVTPAVTNPAVTSDPDSTDAPGTPDTTPSGPDPTKTSIPDPTTPPDPCFPNPCRGGSTCEARSNQEYVCWCLPGQYYHYQAESCQNAKVFPGTLDTNEDFTEAMRNKASEEFKTTAKKITDALEKALNGSGYVESVVLELRPTEKKKYWSLRKGDLVTASVENIYNLESEVTEKQIKDSIEAAGDSCSDPCALKGATFTEKNLCESGPCDKETAKCKSGNGLFNCSCVVGYVQSPYSLRMCIACPSGQKAAGSSCEDCSFGRSGFNCEESWKLILVIVGSVLGALLLMTLIMLPIVARKKPSKKTLKKNAEPDIGNAYISHSPAKAPLVNREPDSRQPAYASSGVPRIPRATTNSWDRSSNLEMTPSNSRQNLVPAGRNMRMYEDLDDVRNGNPYPQKGPQINPYGQNRAQNNQYQGQGQTNSYYMHDDGRRLN